MAEQSMSPTPRMVVVDKVIPEPEKVREAEVVMDFATALKEVLNGKKIHKLEWKDEGFYGFLNEEILSLHKPDGNNYQWIINKGDLEGTDYVVIK